MDYYYQQPEMIPPPSEAVSASKRLIIKNLKAAGLLIVIWIIIVVALKLYVKSAIVGLPIGIAWSIGTAIYISINWVRWLMAILSSGS